MKAYKETYIANTPEYREKERLRAEKSRAGNPEIHRARVRESYQRHAEKRRAERRDYYYAHLEEAKAYAAQYNRKHPRAYNKDARRAKYLRNVEAVAAWSARYYAENKEQVSERGKAYYKANKEAINARISAKAKETPIPNRERRARSTARKHGAQLDTVDYLAILARDGFVCHICKKEVADNQLNFDHVVPFARGGAHSESNIKVAHESCNKRKASKLMSEL